MAPGPQSYARVRHLDVQPEDICVLAPGEHAAQTHRDPFFKAEGGEAQEEAEATATFEVEYRGFDGEEGQQAREAFERAVAIWERHVASDVPIKVDASFRPLGENVLGTAGPISLFLYPVDENEEIIEGETSIYGSALIDAIIGNDTEPDTSDIVARFSSDADWYYGEDEPGPDQVDFTSVVLHELGHGLGFFGSMTVQGGEGFWPFSRRNPEVPAIYDRFAEEGDDLGTRLIDTEVYSNPSQDLADALTSGNLFFNGFQANSGNNSRSPKLYAPSSWSQGSSYSHVDEGIYPAGDENALMTPRIGLQEVIHSPGGAVCGMFADMGWPLGPDCMELVEMDLLAFEVQALSDGSVELAWTLNPDTEKDRFVLERQYFDDPFEPIRIVEAEGQEQFRIELEELGLGEYTFRLRLIDTDGSEDESLSPTREVVVGLRNFMAEAAAEETPSGNYEIMLQWVAPPGTEGFDYIVERCLGEEDSCEDEDFQAITRVEEASERLEYETMTAVTGPGEYTYRLRMVDEEGNVLISDLDRPDIEGFVAIELEGPYDLSPPYPNPFSQSTQVDLTVDRSQRVTVEVYNTLGQRLQQSTQRVGSLRREAITIDGSGLSSGVYLVRITGNDFSATRKLVVAR